MTDQPNLHDWKPLVDDLGERREKALGMGGPALVERQRSMGKLPVRERLDLLARPRQRSSSSASSPTRWIPALAADTGYLAADGMVAGIGDDRRPPGRRRAPTTSP